MVAYQKNPINYGVVGIIKTDILEFNAKMISKLKPKQEEPQLFVAMDQRLL